MTRRSFVTSLFGAVVAAGVALRSEALFGKAVEVEGPTDQFIPLELHIESINRERGSITFIEPVTMTDERLEELKVIYRRLKDDPTYLAHLEESTLLARNKTVQTIPAGTPIWWAVKPQAPAQFQ